MNDEWIIRRICGAHSHELFQIAGCCWLLLVAETTSTRPKCVNYGELLRWSSRQFSSVDCRKWFLFHASPVSVRKWEFFVLRWKSEPKTRDSIWVEINEMNSNKMLRSQVAACRKCLHRQIDCLSSVAVAGVRTPNRKPWHPMDGRWNGISLIATAPMAMAEVVHTASFDPNVLQRLHNNKNNKLISISIFR